MEAGPTSGDDYLRPGPFIDSDHPEVIAFAAGAVGEVGGAGSVEGGGDTEGAGGGTGRGRGREKGGRGVREEAVALYRAVRDRIRYDPYRIDLRPEAMRASATLARGYGFCVSKAVLLAAAARARHIPARLGFADVRNHLTTQRLRRAMGTDVFVYHGYAELLLEGRWVKATPAFNRTLCERFGVPALDFDGIHDSVFQPFDGEGNRYMEYLRDHGQHAELPLDELRRAFEEAYPALVAGGVCDLSGRFEDDAVREPSG